jgi:hypothetical protein
MVLVLSAHLDNTQLLVQLHAKLVRILDVLLVLEPELENAQLALPVIIWRTINVVIVMITSLLPLALPFLLVALALVVIRDVLFVLLLPPHQAVLHVKTAGSTMVILPKTAINALMPIA